MRLYFLLAVCWVILGCSGQSKVRWDLRPRQHYLAGEKLYTQETIVAVVVIDRNTSPAVETIGATGGRILVEQLKVTVEQHIAGLPLAPGSVIEVYWRRPQDLRDAAWTRLKRMILFVDLEDGKWRLATDMVPSYIPCYRKYFASPAQSEGSSSVGQKIANLLLGPELEPDDERNIGIIMQSHVRSSREAAGVLYTRQLVTPLLEHRQVEVREQACMMIFDYLLGDPRCLADVRPTNFNLAKLQVIKTTRDSILRDFRIYISNDFVPRQALAATLGWSFEPTPEKEVFEMLAQSSDPTLSKLGIIGIRSVAKWEE